ncbi:MAG TPA: amidohydrolase family protein [Pseudolabrys sp.]|jgi:2-pyrone-4,6-dicarboxylate lactonase|nr:amidohydrolase family protein [Pseudolabrys sp.]
MNACPADTADSPAEPPTWTESPSRPKLKLPPGACDTHVHVFGPRARFPFAAGRSFTPSDAPKEKLFALHEMIGIERCVIVHTAAHGHDLSVTADAIAAKGGSYLGVGLMPVTISDADLKRLDAQGFRGARFHYMQHLGKGTPIDEVIAFGKRLADIGWHLQIHMAAELIGELTPALKRSPVPVAIDHMGRVDASKGLEQAPFQKLLRLLDDPNVWVKVSGCDRATREGPPYADAVPFARKLVEEAGDRCVWGLDWPHPNHQGPVPDDGTLVDLLAEIAPSEGARQALLVDNPQRFYRFGERLVAGA